MHRLRGREVVACALAAGVAARAGAGLVAPIAPFFGEFTEGFEEMVPAVPVPSAQVFLRPVPPFDYQGDLTAGDDTVLVGHSFSSIFGSAVTPHSGGRFGRIDGRVADFNFENPVLRFGGYFAGNDGLTGQGGTVEFYGAVGNLIGSAPFTTVFQSGPAPWTWNGWVLSEGATRIRILGNVGSFGLNWTDMDDMQLSYVPGPSAFAVVFAGMVITGRRRR